MTLLNEEAVTAIEKQLVGRDLWITDIMDLISPGLLEDYNKAEETGWMTYDEWLCTAYLFLLEEYDSFTPES